MNGDRFPDKKSSTPANAGVDAQQPAGEAPVTKGRLTIFLGYADGVGKTRAMLASGAGRRAEGADVVVASPDAQEGNRNGAHKADLEILPVKRLEYRDGVRFEMDIDAVLARRPQIAIVGDLAHTNLPGMRHPRRYQDVAELREHGIHVYATLNIYHLESLNDIIYQITGTRVRETVPDQLIDEMAVIDLVDMAPDDLLQRIDEGSFHIPDPVGQASEPGSAPTGAGASPGSTTAYRSFYRKGNLMALRELSLRWTANRIDTQMRGYMRSREIAGPWPAAERLMVCISSHPLSERLVRTGRRLAEDLNAEWFVVYVETPDRLRFSQAHSARVSQTLLLAEELGARIMTISGRTVPEAVARFAQEQNITKIVVGRPLRSRWMELINGSVVDEIIRLSRSIDVYVITDEAGPLVKGIPETWRPHSRWTRYLQGVLLVLAVTLVGVPIHLLIDPTNLVMIYLLAVVAAAVYLGRGPSLLVSLLSVLAFDFFFINPRLSLDVTDTQYLLTFLGLLGVSLVTSNLAGLVRDQVEASQQREAQTATLYALSRALTVSLDLPAILQAVIKHVSQTLGREVVILLPGADGLEVRAASPGFTLDENDLSVARWSFDHAQPAGLGTDTLPNAGARYQPLITSQSVVGVLGVRPLQPGRYLTPGQRQLLEAYCSLAALAIERARLADQASQAQVLSAAEKLQTALLNSISHDLRTPLASITGVFSSLHEAALSEEAALPGGNESPADQVLTEQVIMDPGTRLELIETGWEESERMNRLVGNLLDMTRLESGALRLRKEEGDIEDVIGAALARLKTRLSGFTFKTSIPGDRPMVLMDFTLIEQVLVNLLDNAIKYSPSGSQVDIQVSPREQEMEVAVLDRGKGIPPEDIHRVFDKFFRVPRSDGVSGTGLGLSICKGIVEAHGGRIWAENRPGGGLVMTFTLPFAAQPPQEAQAAVDNLQRSLEKEHPHA